MGLGRLFEQRQIDGKAKIVWMLSFQVVACTSIHTAVYLRTQLLELRQGSVRKSISMPKSYADPILLVIVYHGFSLPLYASTYSSHSGFCNPVLVHVFKTSVAQHTFLRMTTPSSTFVNARYFSSSSSALSPCASSTGVLCVCQPVMVLGRPACPTTSTA